MRGYFLAYLDRLVERLRQSHIFHDGHLVIHCLLADAECQIILPFATTVGAAIESTSYLMATA